MAELISKEEYIRWLDLPITQEFMSYLRTMSSYTLDTYITQAVTESSIPLLNQMRGAMAVREAILDPDFYEVINNSGEIKDDEKVDV